MDDDNDDGFAANRERDLDDILRELEQSSHATAGVAKRKQGDGWGATRAREEREEEEETGDDVELADMVAMNAGNQDLDVTVQVRAKHHVGDDKDTYFEQAPATRSKRNQRPSNKKSLGEAEFSAITKKALGATAGLTLQHSQSHISPSKTTTLAFRPPTSQGKHAAQSGRKNKTLQNGLTLRRTSSGVKDKGIGYEGGAKRGIDTLTLRAKDSSAAEDGGPKNRQQRADGALEGANADLAYFTNDSIPQNYNT